MGLAAAAAGAGVAVAAGVGVGVAAGAETAAMPCTVPLRTGMTAGMPCTVAFFGGKGREAGGGGVSTAEPTEPNGEVCMGARTLGGAAFSSSGAGLAAAGAGVAAAAGAGVGVAAGTDVVSGASSGALRTKYR